MDPTTISLVSLGLVLAYETYILRTLSRRIEQSTLLMEQRIMERIATGAWDKPVGDMAERIADRTLGHAIHKALSGVFFNDR